MPEKSFARILVGCCSIPKGCAAEWIDEAFHPGPKSERARAKDRENFKGDASQLTDACRFTLEYKTAEDLLKAVKEVIPAKFGVPVRLKNKHQNPTPLGHRDFNMNMEVGVDGEKHIFEIQANLSPCIGAQKKAHGFYEAVRSELPNIVGDSADWKKVFRYITDRLKESTLDLTVATLSEKADGLMVFAKLLADHLEIVAGEDGQI